MAKQPKILTADQIDSFVEALKATVAAAETGVRLRQLVASFNGAPVSSAASQAKPVAAPKSAAAPKKARTRLPGLDPEKALAGLKGVKNGLALGQLSAKIGEPKKDRVAAALRKLREQKRVVVRGTRKDAVWLAA